MSSTVAAVQPPPKRMQDGIEIVRGAAFYFSKALDKTLKEHLSNYKHAEFLREAIAMAPEARREILYNTIHAAKNPTSPSSRSPEQDRREETNIETLRGTGAVENSVCVVDKNALTLRYALLVKNKDRAAAGVDYINAIARAIRNSSYVVWELLKDADGASNDGTVVVKINSESDVKQVMDARVILREKSRAFVENVRTFLQSGAKDNYLIITTKPETYALVEKMLTEGATRDL